MDVDNDLHLGLDPNFEGEGKFAFNEPIPLDTNFGNLSPVPQTPSNLKRKAPGKENDDPLPVYHIPSAPLLPNPATSFSRLLLSQDEQIMPLNELNSDIARNSNANKKSKRTHLLLDVRTELTDDELKTARTQYSHAQDRLRRAMFLKQSNKYKGQVIEDLVCGVPSCIQAPCLVDFWQQNFKTRVEARAGIYPTEKRPNKRRKTGDLTPSNNDGVLNHEYNQDFHAEMDLDAGMAIPDNYFDFHQDLEQEPASGYLRSSEEPGQGRQASRPRSLLRDLGLSQSVLTGSQKSSLFPWDNAGGSSSSGAPGVPGNHSHVEIKLRESSQSRRGSSLIPSQAGGPGLSPASVMRGSQDLGEDYIFDVDGVQTPAAHLYQPPGDINLINLERNSLNFLEYVKMQSHSLPSSATNLIFDNIVPQATSTRHVAAAAFYHCLVLATKDLLHLEQHKPYDPLFIAIK